MDPLEKSLLSTTNMTSPLWSQYTELVTPGGLVGQLPVAATEFIGGALVLRRALTTVRQYGAPQSIQL